MFLKKIFFIFIFCFHWLIRAYLSTYEAANHLGEVNEVCGFCVSVTSDKDIKGNPVILDFEKKYPEQVFMVIIYEYNLKKFDQKIADLFLNQPVCVKGEINAIKGIPFIIVSEPAQITIMERYKIDSDETYEWKQSRDYHNTWFNNKDRIKLKIILKALGYNVNEKDDTWDLETFRAVKDFQRKKKLQVDGIIKRKVLFEMENTINESKDLTYKQKKELYYIIQSLLKRKI
ncbi:MAG TPA: peptidoglycan-binding domain-containing protein [Candidatus Goldiibacteriota bacterium]|nr:peptidoglycan-binding domain-containing protein [Candidatus Goldiibacteriota bacterium]